MYFSSLNLIPLKNYFSLVYVCRCLQSPEEGVGFSEAGGTAVCEAPTQGAGT